MVRVAVVAIFFLVNAAHTQAESQAKRTYSPVVVLPHGEITRIPSPDRKWILVFECPNDCKERKLWIEESASHARRLVKAYERWLDVSWAPDGRRFFVNDASGSTDTRCYIYQTDSLKETDVSQIVLSSDPSAAQFLNSGHSYLKAKRWNSSLELLVVLEGHNDGAPPRGFTVLYRIGVTGGVHKLSQHVER